MMTGFILSLATITSANGQLDKSERTSSEMVEWLFGMSAVVVLLALFFVLLWWLMKIHEEDVEQRKANRYGTDYNQYG